MGLFFLFLAFGCTVASAVHYAVTIGIIINVFFASIMVLIICHHESKSGGFLAQMLLIDSLLLYIIFNCFQANNLVAIGIVGFLELMLSNYVLKNIGEQ